MNYANVPLTIGRLVSSKLATLAELQNVYGTRDAYDLLEIMMVDDYNAALAQTE